MAWLPLSLIPGSALNSITLLNDKNATSQVVLLSYRPKNTFYILKKKIMMCLSYYELKYICTQEDLLCFVIL